MDAIKDRLFNRETDTISEVIELDIDTAMSAVEDILKKYIVIPDGVSYVKGLRFPLTHRSGLDKYRKYGSVKDSPWHPYLMVPLLKSMLEHYQYTHTDYGKAFIENAGCSGVQVYYAPTDMAAHDLILEVVPDMTSEDLGEVDEIFNNVYHGFLKDVFDKNPDCIYNVDLSTNSYYLMRYIDIRAFRYMEVCNAL